MSTKLSKLKREEYIQHICDMMRELTFKRGRTAKDLAKQWGLSVSAVRNMTSEASRIVSREINDPDAVSADVGLALQKTLERALEDDDRRSVIAGAKVWADITGATAARKVDVEVGEREEITPERAAEIVRARFGKVTPGGNT